MHEINESPCDNGVADPNGELVSIQELVQTAVAEFQSTISRKMIQLDLDLALVHVGCHDFKSLQTVIVDLVKLGIDTTPVGGDLSLTLVDSRYQWELEVADSAPCPTVVWFHDSGKPRGSALIRAVPMLQGKLESVIRMAQAIGGTIQSWACPQGGTANVLTMPHLYRSRAA